MSCVPAIWVRQQDLSLNCALSTLYHTHTGTAAAGRGSMSTKRAAAQQSGKGVSSKKQKLEAPHAADQQLLTDTILALLRKRKPGATC